MDAMLLTEWAQGLITAGCVSLALTVIFCVVRDGIREFRCRVDSNRSEEVLRMSDEQQPEFIEVSSPSQMSAEALDAGATSELIRNPRFVPHIDSDRMRGPSDWDRECQESGRLNRGR